jgi:hypothetical protein
MFVLPWQQLTVFTGDTLSVAECLFVLSSSPQLTTCTFLYLIPGTDGREEITHSSLQDLSISNSAPDVLRYIDLPVLRDLYLTRPTNIRGNVLSQLFARCAPTLHRLHYAPTYRYRDGVSLAWFVAMPQLAELDLSGVGAQFMGDFVRALDRTHAPAFLSCLSTLRIECEWCEVGAELVEALASRCADGDVGLDALSWVLESDPPAQIRSVRLRSFSLVWAEEGWIDVQRVEALLQLARRGMAIHIGSSKENYVRA